MSKRLLKANLILFFLLALISAEAEWYEAALAEGECFSTSSIPSDRDPAVPDNFPADAEEDTSESRGEDEYESHFIVFEGLGKDLLVNLHYTYQHLLFKEHHGELVVPPPKA